VARRPITLSCGLLECIEQAIDLRAGQTEHGVDAMARQAR